jgi:Cytochrome P460
MKVRTSLALAWCALAATAAWPVSLPLSAQAQAPVAAGDGPTYAAGTNNLLRPENYREWIFVGSTLGLDYPAPGQSPRPAQFDSVFVNPSSYRAFMQTGKWPDKTAYALEFRGVGTEAVANRDGHFQTGLQLLEVNVKDSRFPDGWAYFQFPGAGDQSAAPLSGDTVKRCIDCHTAHTAVERTFVQFYPTLFDIAKKMGTVKKDYTDP